MIELTYADLTAGIQKVESAAGEPLMVMYCAIEAEPCSLASKLFEWAQAQGWDAGWTPTLDRESVSFKAGSTRASGRTKREAAENCARCLVEAGYDADEWL